MNQYPPWTAVEDARLIELRESGGTGQQMYAAFPPRSNEAVRHRLHTLRAGGLVR